MLRFGRGQGVEGVSGFVLYNLHSHHNSMFGIDEHCCGTPIQIPFRAFLNVKEERGSSSLALAPPLAQPPPRQKGCSACMGGLARNEGQWHSTYRFLEDRQADKGRLHCPKWNATGQHCLWGLCTCQRQAEQHQEQILRHPVTETWTVSGDEGGCAAQGMARVSGQAL